MLPIRSLKASFQAGSGCERPAAREASLPWKSGVQGAHSPGLQLKLRAVPIQDAYGRWFSDDGRFWWDGRAWQPLGPPAAPGRRSAAPLVVGIGGGLLALVLLFGACTYAMVSSPDFQRGYHKGYCS